MHIRVCVHKMSLRARNPSSSLFYVKLFKTEMLALASSFQLTAYEGFYRKKSLELNSNSAKLQVFAERQKDNNTDMNSF